MKHRSTGESTWSQPVGQQRIAPLSLAELEHAVLAADSTTFLVLPRILRRVIKQHYGVAGFGLRVPHRKSIVIASGPLLEIVDKVELGLTDDATLPEKVILLARPDLRRLSQTPGGDVLVRFWRLLFHAKIHAALDDRIARGELSPAAVRQRIRRLGSAEFEEIRLVLGQEDMLLPPSDDTAVYAEFAAVFLELRLFARSALTRYFPGIEDLDAVYAMLNQDVDVEGLFRVSRPSGAPLPQDQCELDELVDLPVEQDAHCEVEIEPAPRPSRRKYRAWLRQSQRPASQGNVVRAAICRAKAERVAPPEFVGRVQAAIRTDVYRLIRRLQAALEISEAAPQAWQDSLFALVSRTPSAMWTVEARLLYDLQKACVDHERGIYTVDLVEWVLSRGCRPIKRPLPNQRDVLMLKHLRSAARRLVVVRLSDLERRQLARLIQDAMERVEQRLREKLRPQIAAALEAAGFVPRNVPERVARKKMVEELLDEIVERGFLSMGGLRDAISRNNLKLPDLARPLDLLRGDPLMQADRRLSLSLDGVYRRGEIYLRWMQRMSSVGFGTDLGRFVTRFAAVPFGGAYVALAGIHHVWEMIAGSPRPPETPAVGSLAHAGKQGLHLTSPEVVLALGFFLLCLVNSAVFRSAVARFFKVAGRVVRVVAVDPLRRLWQSPFLQRVLHSRPFTFAVRFLVKPLIGTGIAFRLLPIDETNWHTSAGAAALLFVGVNLLLNSRLGRTAEEILVDEIVQGWHRFGLRALTGLFWLIVDKFKALLEMIERLMYAVDEWLRFKGGERRLTTASKAFLGLLWFFFAYVLRFAVNVLIEPQINPIKHFPVVTVSHKMLFPLIPSLATVFELTFDKPLAWTMAVTTIWCIPGVFGFLVWELKENWRLYAANRRTNLSPVLVGSHGESMGRLLQIAFHSGTIPKRFAKLRRAERRAWSDGSWAKVRKHVQAIHHIETSIRRYIERESLQFFAESRSWQSPPPVIEDLRIGINSVRVTFGCPGGLHSTATVALTVEGLWLTGGVAASAWLARLDERERHVFAAVLLGLYKSAGAELVRQQIDAQFPPSPPWYRFSNVGVVLWPDEPGDSTAEVLYDLREASWITPQSIGGLPSQKFPMLERRRLVFADTPISWAAWVDAWKREQSGQEIAVESAASVRVLPPA